MEKHRENKSMEYDNADRKKIFDKLMFGYSSSELLKSLQMTRFPKTIDVPISTRSIGFLCQFLYCKFAKLNIRLPARCSIYPMFRIGLLQMEIKVRQASLQGTFGCRDGRLFIEYPNVSAEQIVAVSALRSHLAPMANLINAVGVLKNFNAVYLPRFAAIEDEPEPTTVRFSNLRSVVRMLSNPATPRDVRRYFYDRSPLPGAKWGGDPAPQAHGRRLSEGDLAAPIRADVGDFPVLLNPDDFMPQEYSMDDLHTDVWDIQNLLECVGRKYPKYVYCGRIDYEGMGQASLLVSNGTGTLRCHDLPRVRDDSMEIDFAARMCLTGKTSQFWTPECLTNPEIYLGIAHLLGEQPHKTSDAYAIRSSTIAKETAHMQYLTVLYNLNNFMF
ncbi:uncharacterized protein LOC143895430 [Temnothorax americanus]|uniref:uncharacterized protein LOC143895430 n=1 Tax=Temnothorax americanus TaxID=1964332 RepID=UPI004068359B